MLAYTNHAAQQIIKALLLKEQVSFPATWYVGFFTADPGAAGELTDEIADPAYTRLEVNWSAPKYSEELGTHSDNVYEIEFDEAGVSWGEITHVGMLDAETAGTMWLKGPLVESKVIGKGDFARFPAGRLVFLLQRLPAQGVE